MVLLGFSKSGEGLDICLVFIAVGPTRYFKELSSNGKTKVKVQLNGEDDVFNIDGSNL